MRKQERLFEIADSQQGYFTSRQAEECGYPRSHFCRKIAIGEWEKEQRGIYRLAHYPLCERSDLVIWSLWSRSQKGEIIGVWSHETALSIYDLSDVMPSKLHMTVPPEFSRKKIPDAIELHYQYLHISEIRSYGGYKVTTPIKTILDIIQVGYIADNFIAQAITEALNEGLIIKEDIRGIKQHYPVEYQKIQELLKPQAHAVLI